MLIPTNVPPNSVAAATAAQIAPDTAGSAAETQGAPIVVYPDIPDAPPSHVYPAWRARPVAPRSVQRFLGAFRPDQSIRGMRPSMSVNP